MSYLKAAILCFTIALIALSQISCGPTWKEVTPPLGQYKALVSITVQEDWCMIDGQAVNGLILYNETTREFCVICVSLKSDDPERTMQHELSHCWRNMMGLDPKARNE
jgi:hypothetical protein